ncbi:MAG: beta-hydroxyacyl-ACP dehydratase [Alistipes sp.]|jgi:3-hydroxyacyl-[acyl-carrier-protein] dehydratase|nr:beta-hydroxyacyl-ACP dehydratase [Alistipes sp.]
MNPLYTITAGPETGVFEVRLDRDHEIFAGHFPGTPVLPGVCGMMLVRECASRMTGRQMRYSAIRESKFLTAITPDSTLTVALRLVGVEDGAFSLDATIHAGQTTMMKIKSTLSTDE